jgi:8-oxo-dGTP pyrophosphatase MutT (NUDIX family)
MANDAQRTGRAPAAGKRTTEPDVDPGAYIGRLPEREAETIPGGVTRKDERVAAIASQPGARSPEPETPGGHREGESANDAAIREAGQDR